MMTNIEDMNENGKGGWGNADEDPYPSVHRF